MSAASRPHQWRCPVTMKTDPDRIAYTCARCGAIAAVLADQPGPEPGDCKAPPR